MKKPEIVEAAARRQGLKPGAAADQMDRAVNRILRALRSGQSARLPGIGVITPGKPRRLEPEE